jgi:hypothetical protein
MPVLVGKIRGDASSAPEIVILSVGSDGMETNRDILSLAEAERLILSIRRAIGASRPGPVKVGHRPALERRRTLRWQGGGTLVDIYGPHPILVCRVCDDNDHCLPRWEDDGGAKARPQPPAQAFEEAVTSMPRLA